MITREEIRSIPELHKSIQHDKEQLRYLQEKATAVPSSIPDHDRVQTSPDNDQMWCIEAAADLDRDIRQKEIQLIELQSKAHEFIMTVDDPATRKILKYRYLKCYTWERISEITGYTERHIRRIEFKILKNVLPCPPMSGV